MTAADRSGAEGSETDGSGPALQLANLHVTFATAAGDLRAVRGLSYHVAPGEVLGITGESGSGKSVGALAVMGLLPRSARVSGSVRLYGRELLGMNDKDLAAIRGKDLAMIFQDPLSALTPVYPVGDQIAETIRIHTGATKDAARRGAVDLLDLVGIPNPARRAKAFPHEFSGGMRQRVMIAMAIANEPHVIIADEPTTALDVTIQAQVLAVLRTARRATGAAIVMIAHDLGVLAGIADRVLVMYAGRAVEIGDVDDVYHRPRMPYTIGLLGSVPRPDRGGRTPLVPIEGAPPAPVNPPPGCAFAPRCPIAAAGCATTEPELRPTRAPGHTVACVKTDQIERRALGVAEMFPPPKVEAAPEAGPRGRLPMVLQVDGLVRHYRLRGDGVFRRRVGTVRAVDGIGFDIRAGETLGLVGESGCGKTSVLLEVLRLARPKAGRVVVLGRDTGLLSGAERKALRRDVQVVFQDPLASLDPRMPVRDILAEPLRTHGHRRNAIGPRVRELLALVGLEPGHAARYPQDLSGGQRQRIGIARALALEPGLLLLDEPVSALDVSVQAGVLNLLADLQVRLNLSYLFAAHDLAVVRHVADRVAVMYLGRIVEIGAVDEVYGAPAHPYTQALLSAAALPGPRTEPSRRRIILAGEPPSPSDPPPVGCRFGTRCPRFAVLDEDARRRCVTKEPSLRSMREPDQVREPDQGPDHEQDHRAACHHAEQAGIPLDPAVLDPIALDLAAPDLASVDPITPTPKENR